MKNVWFIIMRWNKEEPQKEFYVIADTINNAIMKVGNYGGSITSIKMVASEDTTTFEKVAKFVT